MARFKLYPKAPPKITEITQFLPEFDAPPPSENLSILSLRPQWRLEMFYRSLCNVHVFEVMDHCAVHHFSRMGLKSKLLQSEIAHLKF